MLTEIKMEINLAYYRKKDWRKFLSMIDDRESTCLIHGINGIEENLIELDKFCRENGLKNIGKTRSQFVSIGK